MREIRGGRISMIFQDPMTSLNPFLRISTQMLEGLKLHSDLEGKAALHKAIEALEEVGISEAANRIHGYPHEFSGGMRQRVMIASALITEPDLLIADEPTTALDVTIQAQILEVIKERQQRLGTAVILVTHDLGVVAGNCDRVNVMYAGRIVESGSTDQIFYEPKHAYTQALHKAIPSLQMKGDLLYTVPGMPPDLIKPIQGCAFYPRCPYPKVRGARRAAARDGRPCRRPLRAGLPLLRSRGADRSGAEQGRSRGDRMTGAQEKAERMAPRDDFLVLEKVSQHFDLGKRFLTGKSKGVVKAVDNVSLTIREGEILGLVGESGCGKTTLSRTIMQLIRPTSGKIFLEGRELSALSDKEIRHQRINFQMIFQDPYASLNPRMTVYDASGRGDPHSPSGRSRRWRFARG
jgi:oligopeptide/dipeptide ABC transporter ATP-binding protein